MTNFHFPISKYKKESKGFTFLELMVTVGMIVIVLTASAVSYRQSTRRMEVTLVAQQLAGDIRLMESYAASSRQHLNDQKRNIWGVYADKNKSGQYVLYTSDSDGLYADANLYRKVLLPKQVILSAVGCIDASGNKTEKTDGAVAFIPPDPSVKFANGASTCPSGVYFTLKDRISNVTKDVTANYFGLVDILR